MRKLVAILAVAVFGLYCYSVYMQYTYVPVPAYGAETVDLFGGKSRRAWEADPTFQADYFDRLERKGYQPPEGGMVLPDGKRLAASERLAAEDYRQLAEAKTSNGAAPTVTLRDPAPLEALAGRRYRVRNPMPQLDLRGGEDLDKVLIDRLIDEKVERIAVVGNGDAVAVQFGTMLMLVAIFLGLAMAMEEVFWKPILAVIDHRRAAVEDGTALARRNAQEARKLEEERRERRLAARREYLDRLHQAQREALKEADGLLRETKEKTHKMARDERKALEKASSEAREALSAEVPALAEQVAAAVLDREVNRG